MINKFSLEIKSPCDENIKDMKPNANGYFCDSCVKNVIDLSLKSKTEVAQFITKNKNNNSICARLKIAQLEEEFEINEISNLQNFKYAAVIAATFLLASPVLSQEKTPPKTEINSPKPNLEIMGKMISRPVQSKMISFVFEGKIVDEVSKKAMSSYQFPNLEIYITGAKSSVKVDAKIGNFSIPVVLDDEQTQLYLTISSGDLTYSKTINIDLKKINAAVLKQTILVNPKEFYQMHIAGGLGINFIDNKKNKNS